jgi:hypothetical protein
MFIYFKQLGIYHIPGFPFKMVIVRRACLLSILGVLRIQLVPFSHSFGSSRKRHAEIKYDELLMAGRVGFDIRGLVKN